MCHSHKKMFWSVVLPQATWASSKWRNGKPKHLLILMQHCASSCKRLSASRWVFCSRTFGTYYKNILWLSTWLNFCVPFVLQTLRVSNNYTCSYSISMLCVYIPTFTLFSFLFLSHDVLWNAQENMHDPVFSLCPFCLIWGKFFTQVWKKLKYAPARHKQQDIKFFPNHFMGILGIHSKHISSENTGKSTG